MADVTHVLVDDEPSISGASWGAIFAGAVVSLAVTFVVIAFGTGLGLSVVSPWETSGVSATTFKIGTGIFLIVTAMFSSSLGGYIAGRLRTRWVGVHTDEVYFRDTAHGFVAWAVAAVIGFALLAAPSVSLLGNTASGAMQAAGNASSGPAEMYVDRPRSSKAQRRRIIAAKSPGCSLRAIRTAATSSPTTAPISPRWLRTARA